MKISLEIRSLAYAQRYVTFFLMVALLILTLAVVFTVLWGKTIKSGVFGEWGVVPKPSVKEIQEFFADATHFYSRSLSDENGPYIVVTCDRGDIAISGGCFIENMKDSPLKQETMPPLLNTLMSNVTQDDDATKKKRRLGRHECSWAIPYGRDPGYRVKTKASVHCLKMDPNYQYVE